MKVYQLVDVDHRFSKEVWLDKEQEICMPKKKPIREPTTPCDNWYGVMSYHALAYKENHLSSTNNSEEFKNVMRLGNDSQIKRSEK